MKLIQPDIKVLYNIIHKKTATPVIQEFHLWTDIDSIEKGKIPESAVNVYKYTNFVLYSISEHCFSGFALKPKLFGSHTRFFLHMVGSQLG